MHSDWGRDMSPGIQLAEEIREGCLEEAMAILILKKLTSKGGHGYGWWPGQRTSCPRQEGNHSNERPSLCLVDINPLPGEEIPRQCYLILFPYHMTSSVSERG